MNKMLKTWVLFLMSDLVKVDVNEDGEDVIQEFWYAVAEDGFGSRFREPRGTVRAEAEERLGLYVADGGVDGKASWTEMQAAYGSEAYLVQEPEIVAAERRADMEAAW